MNFIPSVFFCTLSTGKSIHSSQRCSRHFNVSCMLGEKTALTTFLFLEFKDVQYLIATKTSYVKPDQRPPQRDERLTFNQLNLRNVQNFIVPKLRLKNVENVYSNKFFVFGFCCFPNHNSTVAYHLSPHLSNFIIGGYSIWPFRMSHVT